jgi:hypothetical protein
MNILIISSFVALIFLCGCQNPGIVQVSPNTYMLSREDHAGIFGSMSKLKTGVIQDVKTFAEKQEKVAIPISAKEHPVGVLADWASFEVIFKLASTNDPEALGSTNIWTSSSVQGGQGWRNLGGKARLYPAQPKTSGNQAVQPPTIGQQVIDLQKAKDAGAINDSEYQAEKSRLLKSQQTP